jgi:thiamine biosynthesis lipoprotein
MNMRIRFIAIAAFVMLASVTRAGNPPKNRLYIANYENVLGTSFEIKIKAQTDAGAQKAEAAALTEIDRLNKILSGYDANSEFSRWMRAPQKPVKVSTELYEVLALFDSWREKTGGALNASAETINKVWREAAAKKSLPSTTEITAALAQVNQQQYVLDALAHTALHTGNAPLMLNSFTKSYIMNKAAAVAMAVSGVNGLVLNIGGDIVIRGEHTEQINVSNPKADYENAAPIAQLKVSDRTVATSGNYRRGEEINGVWYSHIIDPRTGQPAGGVISATVVAPNATDAGALATALNVLSPAEGEKLVATVPGAEFMLITADGKRIESAGWKMLELPAEKTEAATPSATVLQQSWDPNYELAINLELATLQGFRINRPYVAVWVVDADKKPVRQIALWMRATKEKYLWDMRSWYTAYYSDLMADKPSVSSTTSATRSAGKYTLKWDGKDDKGNLVKQGTYTLYIEAAREHGTHQLMKQDITISKPQPQHFDLGDNIEISSASLDLRKKTNE